MKELNETTNLIEYMAAGGQPDSAANQRVRDDLVARNVKACLSSLIFTLINSDGFSDDEDIMALNIAYDYEESCRQEGWVPWSELGAAITDTLEEGVVPGEFAKVEAGIIDNTSDANDWEELCRETGIDPEYREVYEHWLVDRWFLARLNEFGETTGEFADLPIWGRCTTGQSISMDHIIADIAASMEILDGQRYSCAKEERT